MKGLFLKEFYSVNVYKKSMLLMLAVIVVMSFALPLGGSYVPTMVMVYMVMTLMNLFALDDSSKWDRYAVSLPLSRWSIVAVRYLFLSIITVAANVAAFALSVVIGAVRGQQESLLQSLLVSASLLMVFLLIASVSMPLCYRFGAEKSRMVMMAVFGLVYLGFIWSLPKLKPMLEGSPSSTVTVLVAGAVVLTLVLYTVSYLVSVRIYAKKEF